MAATMGDEEDVQYLMMDVLQSNVKQIELARSFLCVVGGCCAGVVNATNLGGLVVFLLVYLSIVGGTSMKVGFDFKNYANNTFFGFLLSDLSKHGLSFVLFWTLTYALVYIY